MREGSGSAIFRIYLSTSTASRFYTGAVFLFDRLPETEIPGNEIATRMEAQENTIDHPVEGEIPATGLETRGPVIVRPNGAYIHPSHQPKGKLCEAKKEKIAGQDLSGIIMWNGDDDSMSLSRDEGKEDPLWVSKTTFAHRNTGKPEGAHRLRHTGKSPLEDHLYELVFVEENMESKLTVEWTQTETTGRIRVWKVPANQIGDSPVDITEVGENITQALESGARFSQQTIDRNVFLFESYEVTPKPGCGIGKKIELKVTPPGQAETKAFRFFLTSFGASLEGVQDPEKGWGTVDFYKEDGKQFVPHVNLARWASAYDGSEDVNDGIQLLDRDFFDGAAQRFRVEVRGPYYQYEEGNPVPVSLSVATYPRGTFPRHPETKPEDRMDRIRNVTTSKQQNEEEIFQSEWLIPVANERDTFQHLGAIEEGNHGGLPEVIGNGGYDDEFDNEETTSDGGMDGYNQETDGTGTKGSDRTLRAEPGGFVKVRRVLEVITKVEAVAHDKDKGCIIENVDGAGGKQRYIARYVFYVGRNRAVVDGGNSPSTFASVKRDVGEFVVRPVLVEHEDGTAEPVKIVNSLKRLEDRFAQAGVVPKVKGEGGTEPVDEVDKDHIVTSTPPERTMLTISQGFGYPAGNSGNEPFDRFDIGFVIDGQAVGFGEDENGDADYTQPTIHVDLKEDGEVEPMEAAGLIKAGLTGSGFSGETFENVIEENTNSDYGSADVLVTEGEEFVDIEWIVGGLSRRQETMKMKIR